VVNSPATGEWGVSKEKAFVRMILQDNGIGFAQSDAERIFKTFLRLNSKDKFEGTGLGLSLCKKIVERHGGSIWAEGKPGEGAVFTILLPAFHERVM
jgi:signal transduction histidine kinase